MAVQDAVGSLARSLKDLQVRWDEVRPHWRDDVSAAFEDKYLRDWERTFRTTLSQVETMATYLGQIRRDCE